MTQASTPAIGTAGLPISSVPGITYRRLNAPADYPRMNEIANDVRISQGDSFYTTVDQLQQFYDHMENCDLSRDLFLVELDHRLIGYIRIGWRDQPAKRQYEPVVFLDPAVVTATILGEACDIAERRMTEVAAAHPRGPKVAGMNASEAMRAASLTDRGYTLVRTFYTMVRPTLDDLPDAPLPEGLEIRDVRREDMEQVYQAEIEAFRGHWGFAEHGVRERHDFFDDPVESDTSLWRVAWDGDQVAGMVRSYIHPEQNERLGVKRGWVEHISVGRPWRRRGLARALIAASFPLLRARGMTEGALGVDSENETGALRVYERCGFVVVSQSSDYSRTLEEA
jgi:mycothiol synthase